MRAIVIDARRRLEELREALEQNIGGDGNAAKERALAETNAAIDRIDTGTYGRCERCGDAIGRQRLLALPAVRFCLSCAAVAQAT
jgi:RNA polymerase-binding transcription factor DksA